MNIEIVPSRSEICQREPSKNQAAIKTETKSTVEIAPTPPVTNTEKKPQKTTA